MMKSQVGPSQDARGDSKSSSADKASGNVADEAEDTSTTEASGAPSAPSGPAMEQPSPSWRGTDCAEADLPEQSTAMQHEVRNILFAAACCVHVCLPCAQHDGLQCMLAFQCR